MKKQSSNYIEKKIDLVLEEEQEAMKKLVRIKKFAMIKQLLKIKKKSRELRNVNLKDLKKELLNYLKEDF